MNRRDWLKSAGKWMVGLGLFYPLYRFVVQVRYRPPVQVQIRETLKPGQHILEHEFALFQTMDGPIAVSRRCTHLGCLVNYQDTEKIFLCPCHQSRFQWDGKYISGPAKKDLPKLAVKTLEGDKGYLVEIPKGRV